jgi:hypothetical protein
VPDPAWSSFIRDVGVTPPVVVSMTLTGVKGFKVLHGPWGSYEPDATLDRDVVMTPETIMVDFATPGDVVLRPPFDFIWNGGGWSGSPNYPEGRWVAPKSAAWY